MVITRQEINQRYYQRRIHSEKYVKKVAKIKEEKPISPQHDADCDKIVDILMAYFVKIYHGSK